MWRTMCVCVRERGSEGGRGIERAQEREQERERASERERERARARERGSLTAARNRRDWRIWRPRVLEFRVHVLGFWVYGVGFRQSLGFRV